MAESIAVRSLRHATLGDFLYLERIGASHSREGSFYGANSIVCRGTSRKDGHEYALKALLTPSSGDEQSIDALRTKFETELQLGDASKSRLPGSPHIIRAVRSFVADVSALPGWRRLQEIFGGALAPQTFVLVMPMMALNLKSVVSDVRRGAHPPLEEPLLLTWFHQIVAGAKHLHDHGVCHRDLKLDNVLLSGEVDPHARRVAIADLGEAIDCADPPHAVDWVVNWMAGTKKGGAQIALAPEVLEVKPSRRAQIDYACNDAWALGRVLNDILREEAPYTTDSTTSLFVPLPESLPLGRELHDLHRSLLDRDPTTRTTIDGALELVARGLHRRGVAAWGEAGAGSAAAAPAASAPPPDFLNGAAATGAVVTLEHVTLGRRLDLRGGYFVGDLRVRAAIAFAQPLARTQLVLEGTELIDDGAMLEVIGALEKTLVHVVDRPQPSLMKAHAEISRLQEALSVSEQRTIEAEAMYTRLVALELAKVTPTVAPSATPAGGGGGGGGEGGRDAAWLAPPPHRSSGPPTRRGSRSASGTAPMQLAAARVAPRSPLPRLNTLIRVKVSVLQWKRGFVLNINRDNCGLVQVFFGSTGVAAVQLVATAAGRSVRPWESVVEGRAACLRKLLGTLDDGQYIDDAVDIRRRLYDALAMEPEVVAAQRALRLTRIKSEHKARQQRGGTRAQQQSASPAVRRAIAGGRGGR